MSRPVMNRLLRARRGWMIALFLVAEVFAIGAGMGLPVFAILLGFPIGWLSARRQLERSADTSTAMRGALWAAASAGLVTFVFMALIWGPIVPVAWGPTAEVVKNTGYGSIPLLLYEPRASLIAWLVLMLVISPDLQLMCALTAAYVTIAARGR